MHILAAQAIADGDRITTMMRAYEDSVDSILPINDKSRLSQQSTGSPPVKFTVCQWVSGRLVKRDIGLGDVEYVTISHVWGKPEWRDVP